MKPTTRTTRRWPLMTASRQEEEMAVMMMMKISGSQVEARILGWMDPGQAGPSPPLSKRRSSFQNVLCPSRPRLRGNYQHIYQQHNDILGLMVHWARLDFNLKVDLPGISTPWKFFMQLSLSGRRLTRSQVT